MKKEESFEQRDKLYSFAREHKPISSFVRSTCNSKKRKNVIVDVHRRKSTRVLETNSSVELNAKQSSSRRHRTGSTDIGINKHYSKSESNDDDSDCTPNNLELKRRKIINLNYYSNSKLDTDDSTEMVPHRRKANVTRRIHPQSAIIKQNSNLLNTRISTNSIPKQLNNIRFENRSSESDENIPEKYSNNTLESNIKTSIIKNNRTNVFEPVSPLNLNTNINPNNRLNKDETKCICNTKSCTLKARLLASTTNNTNTPNQNLIEANCTALVNNSKIASTTPATIENNIERVSTLESDVILCLANLKNFVNSEAAQLNDTISKIPLRSIVDPVCVTQSTPQISNINQNHHQRSDNIESQINPPYNINIVNPANSQASPQKSTENGLFHKYIQNKEGLTKNIKLFLEQNRKQYHELVQQRNACISELHYAERAKDYFKVEWIKTRLQYLNHLIEKIKTDCKYDSSEINKFVLRNHQQIPPTSSTETEKNTYQQMLPQVSDRMEKIKKEFNLRQEQLNFFSNDSLIEGNRVLKYPFGGIITNINEHSNIKQTPKDKLVKQNQVEPPKHSTKQIPIPQYLMQNHTIVRSPEKEVTPTEQKRTNNSNNNSDKILFKPYENTFNQKSKPPKSINKTHLQHPGNSSILMPPPPYNQHFFNNPPNYNPNMTKINSAIKVPQNKKHQHPFAIDQIMSKQHQNLNHSTYTNHNIANIFAKPYINSAASIRAPFPIQQQNVNIQSNYLDKQKNTLRSTTNRKENEVKNSQVKQTNTNVDGSKSAKKQKGGSSIIHCAPKTNAASDINIENNSMLIIKKPIIVNDKKIIGINEITNNNPLVPVSQSNIPKTQLTEQVLRPKPALIPIGAIKKLKNKVVSVPKIIEQSNEQNKSTTIANEEIPTKRIKLDNNPSILLNTKINTNEEERENVTQVKDNTPKIINENLKIVTEINSVTETININESSANKNIDEEISDSTKEKEEKVENEENNKRKTHLRLQFNLISNKTITLSYLLKMMNQNLNCNSFSNFILKPKNIEELCNIIRKREIFSKIERNSPYQYPSVLTIMNHFLIYVIVCIQIDNKINYKELYLKLIRDKDPIRYNYYHEPDPISLENIDMYLQKAAIELHEAIILNSAESSMKNNKCIYSKIKTFNKYNSQNNKEEFGKNYFIKAHGETEISIIVFYEPNLKSATMTKKFTQKSQNHDLSHFSTMSPTVNTSTFDKVSDVKQKNLSQNLENNVTNNFTTEHKTNVVPLKILPQENQLTNSDSNKNMTFNLKISQLTKSFENCEKLLEIPTNQQIQILENQQIHQDRLSDVSDAKIKDTTNKNKQTKNGSKRKNSSSPDLNKTFDNIRNDMENNNELVSISEEELAKEIDLLDRNVNVNNENIRKRRVSLSETCLEPSLKNIRIQAEEILNSDKVKILQDQMKCSFNKQNNANAEKLNKSKETIAPEENTIENSKSNNELIYNKSPDFAKINKYKVIKVDEKANLDPSLHETIANYWSNTNKDQVNNPKTLQKRDEKIEHTITSETLVASIIDDTKKYIKNASKQDKEKIEHKINKEIIIQKKENNNKVPEKIIEIQESSFEIGKKYYDNPKLKITSNINKNHIFQKTPLDLSKPIKNIKEMKTNKITVANIKKSKTENKNIVIQKSHSNIKNCSKHENTFLGDTFLDSNKACFGQENKKQLKNVNETKFCINFNTLVYINEIDYQIILEILNEAAKPLYTFYKFVNTTRWNNNQRLINFTAFFFGLKFKKLQKYKKMYEQMYKK